MADFTSSFWSWFIAISTVVSIVALTYFVLVVGAKKKKPGEKVETMGHVWDENLEEYNNPLPRWWFNLFLLTLFWGCLYLFLYPGLGNYAGYLGWSQEEQYAQEMQQAEERYGPIFERFINEDIPSLANNEEALVIGKRLFANYCTTCHGSDARGARGYPNLRDHDWLYGNSPQAIKTSIAQGRRGVMAPWQAVLGDEGVFQTAEYVRSLSGLSADVQIAAKGKKHYQMYCAACHNADGTGNQMLGAPNLTDDIWLYGGSQKRIMETIALGRNGVMPGHKEFLGDAKIHVLTAYLYNLAQQAEVEKSAKQN